MSEKEKKSSRRRCDQKTSSSFSSRSPSGMVHVFATLTEAPDRAIWRRMGVEAAGDVAILSGRCPTELSLEKLFSRDKEVEERVRESFFFFERRHFHSGKKRPHLLALSHSALYSDRLLLQSLDRSTWSIIRSERGGAERPRPPRDWRAARRCSTLPLLKPPTRQRRNRHRGPPLPGRAGLRPSRRFLIFLQRCSWRFHGE